MCICLQIFLSCKQSFMWIKYFASVMETFAIIVCDLVVKYLQPAIPYESWINWARHNNFQFVCFRLNLLYHAERHFMLLSQFYFCFENTTWHVNVIMPLSCPKEFDGELDGEWGFLITRSFYFSTHTCITELAICLILLSFKEVFNFF